MVSGELQKNLSPPHPDVNVLERPSGDAWPLFTTRRVLLCSVSGLFGATGIKIRGSRGVRPTSRIDAGCFVSTVVLATGSTRVLVLVPLLLLLLLLLATTTAATTGTTY